jgi:hypothetical protein
MCLQIQDFNANVIFGSRILYKEEPEDHLTGPLRSLQVRSVCAACGPFSGYLHGEVRASGQPGLIAGRTAVSNGPNRKIGANSG